MKYIALKDTLDGGRLVLEGSIIEGEGLDKKFPGIFRKANITEKDNQSQKNIGEKQLTVLKAEIVEEVKAEVIRFIEEKLDKIQIADEQNGNSNS